MKYFSTGLLTLLFSILTLHLSSQAVGINNSLPDASSILDIKSTTDGLLIPRMSSAQRIAIPLPAIGLTVFDTTTQSFWYRTTSGWINSVSPMKEAAYIYNIDPQLCFAESDLTFSTNGYLSPGITHFPGTDDILFYDSGVYKISFSVSANEPNQFAIFMNGIQVPGSIYGSGGGTQQNNGMSIVNIIPGDIITLRNHTSFSAVTLSTTAGGTQTIVNASILMEQL